MGGFIMADYKTAFTRFNTFVFRLSGGRIGSKMGRQNVLLLQTVGRKSGKTYSTPLSYYLDGDRYLLVASNWGQEALPNWFLNLKSHPVTSIQVKGRVIPVSFTQADGEEYGRLWKLITEQNTMYLGYQEKVSRRLPIVVLTPGQATL
jgi:F420H(2)-dependent quinone reductase